jgi:hypothetical protein
MEDKKGTILQILSKFSGTYCRSRKLKTIEFLKNFKDSFNLQERSWTKKTIGDGFRSAGQETDRIFKRTILELRAFCGQESAVNRGEFSGWTARRHHSSTRNYSKNESNSSGLVKILLESEIRGSRQASRRLTRKQ